MHNGDECKTVHNNSNRMRMHDDADLYSRANDVTRRDTKHLLEKYSHTFQWKKNPRVIDIGSGDGSVTKLLSKYLPIDYKVLVGADLNENSVRYANDNYKDEKIKFVPINIEGEVPDDMNEAYDNVFSFYTFMWVRDHKRAFTNIYKMLSEDGECFVMFLGYCQVYSIFYALSKSEKWAPWMKDFNGFPSPYWDVRDPEADLMNKLKDIGFRSIDVRCKQMTHFYDGIEHMKRLVSAINPFSIPKDMWPEFLEDFIEVIRAIKLIDEETGAIKIIYNLLVVHCTK